MGSRRDEGFHSESILSWVFSPFRQLARWVASFAGDGKSFGRSTTDEPLWRSFLLFPLRLAVGFFQFLISNWSTSRSGRTFFLGLPVLGVIALGMMLEVAAIYLLEKRQIPFYTDRAIYYSEHDKPFALHCTEKLVAIKPTDEHKYLLGVARDLNKDFNGALDVMRSIAPDDRSGHPSAHLWIARAAENSKDWNLLPKERMEIATRHYSHATEGANADSSDIDSTEAWTGIVAMNRLAEFQIGEKNFAEAEKTLQGILEQRLTTIFHLSAVSKLMAVYKEQNKTQEIAVMAAKLEPRLVELASNFPERVEPWQTLIDVISQAGNFQQAHEYAKDALSMIKSQNTRLEIYRLQCLLWLRQANEIVDVSTEEKYVEKFGFITQAIAIAPMDPTPYFSALDYVDLENQQPNEDDWLRFSLGNSQAPAITHIVLGIRDALRNQLDSSANHWAIANTQFPHVPFVTGGFIRVMIRSKRFSNDEMMQLLDFVFAQFPKQPYLNIPRAELLIEMNRLEEAVSTVEQSMGQLVDNLDAHLVLEQALRRAGQIEKADQELAKIDELKRRTTSTPAK